MADRRANRQEWQKRVDRWRASGLTAKEFAAEMGINAGTLQFWSCNAPKDPSHSRRKNRPHLPAANKTTRTEWSRSGGVSPEVRSHGGRGRCSWSFHPLPADLALILRDRLQAALDQLNAELREAGYGDSEGEP